MNSKISLSVVIPVYNSQLTLPKLCSALAETLPAVCDDFEVILVNDGSADQSWEIISDLAKKYAWLDGINLMRNYGQHNALLCGIQAVKHELVVTMDDDLQHPPEEIPKLLDKLAEGFDVVYGTPQKKEHGLWRNLASRLIRLTLQNSMKIDTAKDVSAFRVFRSHLFKIYKNHNSPYIFIDVLLSKVTTKFSAVEVAHKPRQIGKSTYSFGKLLLQAITMITGFSTLPLRFASLIGFGFMFFGFILLIYVLGRFIIVGYSVPGFPFLASAIAIFSGVQLFALGIIGEYLALIYLRMMNYPTYVVQSTTKANSQTHE